MRLRSTSRRALASGRHIVLPRTRPPPPPRPFAAGAGHGEGIGPRRHRRLPSRVRAFNTRSARQRSRARVRSLARRRRRSRDTCTARAGSARARSAASPRRGRIKRATQRRRARVRDDLARPRRPRRRRSGALQDEPQALAPPARAARARRGGPHWALGGTLCPAQREGAVEDAVGHLVLARQRHLACGPRRRSAAPRWYRPRSRCRRAATSLATMRSSCLLRSLRSALAEHVLGLGGEADHQPLAGAPAQLAEDVDRAFELEPQRPRPAS